MAKYAPQSNEFDTVVRIDKFHSALLYISIVVSLLPTLDYELRWLNLFTIFIIITLIILLFSVQLYRDFRLNKAENIRRDTLIDNAFKTKLGEETSKEYYDNDDLDCGYKKLLTNICQNSMFSARISEIMFKKSLLPLVLLIFAIIWCSVIGFANLTIAVPLLQALLSALFLIRTIQIGFYKHNTCCVYDKAKSLLVEAPSNDSIFIANVLQLLVRYESNISRFQIVLDGKTYEKINDEMTKKWDDFKSRYINQTD